MTQKSKISFLSLIFFVTGIASLQAATYEINTDTTFSNDYSAAVNAFDSITVNSATVTCDSSATGNSVTRNWYVNSGTLITSSTAGSLTNVDAKFGSGILYMNNSTLAAVTNRGNVNNNIVVTGTLTLNSAEPGLNVYGDISGDSTTSIQRNGGYCAYIYGDNSSFAGAWYLNADYLGINSANSLGTGTVHYNGGALNNKNWAAATLSNAISIDKKIIHFSTDGSSITLTGKLTGSADVSLCSNHYRATTTTNLRGDGSEFTGNWTISETNTLNENTRSTALVVTTNNANPVKNTAASSDDRFGSGSITIGHGVLGVSSDVNLAYVHNNVALASYTQTTDGTDSTVSSLTPFSFDGKQLFLTRNLSGTCSVTISNTIAPAYNSVKSRLYLMGNNASFSGDWILTNTFLVSNAGNTSGKAFGTGTIYLKGGSGLVGWSSTSTTNTYNTSRADTYVYNKIVNSGTNFLVSSGDTISGGTSIPNFQLNLRGDISGDGLLVRVGGGYKCTLAGNNSAYTGDWLLVSDYVTTGNAASNAGNDAATHTDHGFGSGTIYFNGGGIQSSPAIFNNITVNTGKTGYFRNSSMTLYGTVSVDKNASLTMFETGNTLTIAGKLQGLGTVNSRIATTSGSTIAPGVVGISVYDGSYNKTTVTDTNIGTLTFTRNLALGSGTMLEIEAASLTNYDKIALKITDPNYSNALSLDGVTISLLFDKDFDFSQFQYQNEYFSEIITGAELSGTPTLVYDAEVFKQAYDTAFLVANITDGKLVLYASGDPAALPEPASWLLLAAGVFFGSFCVKRRFQKPEYA